MSNRVGGRGVTVAADQLSKQVRVKVLKDIDEAVSWIDKGYRDIISHQRGQRRIAYLQQREESREWEKALRVGMPERLATVMAKAEVLIDEAIACDHRLARKGEFALTDDASTACGFNAAAIAAGEDNPYFSRVNRKLNSNRTHGESVRIVLSTDSKEITDDHAAAFIAAAKLAQQFRPLEIFWQGAWLHKFKREGSDYESTCGTVFLCPLLNGDLDFARIQFVLSHERRDNLSHKIAWGLAQPDESSADEEARKHSHIDGGRGEYSHHPDRTDFFVPESGISPYGWNVASVAAAWAGFEATYYEQPREDGAVQVWEPDKDKPARTAQEMEEDKAKWERRDAENRARMEKDKTMRMVPIEGATLADKLNNAAS